MAEVDRELIALFRELVGGRAAWPLYLHGPVGTGKTCAVLALCDFVADSLYTTVDEVIKYYLDKGIVWQRISEVQLLVADEIGAREKVTDLPYLSFKAVTDVRDRQPTVYVGNIAPDDVSRVYDDRIASRVLRGTWFNLAGDDRRMLV